MDDYPNFAAWHRDTLDRFAAEAYERLRAQENAIEGLRLDLREALKIIRELNK